MASIHPLTLRCVLLASIIAAGAQSAAAQATSPSSSKPETKSAAKARAAAARAARAEATLVAPLVQAEALSLRDVVARLRETNRSILSKQAEAAITATGIERAESAFQPQLNIAALRGVTTQKRTFEEALLQSDRGIYRREGNDVSVGVSTVVPATGAKLEVKSALSRFLTNQPDPQRPSDDAAYNRSTLGFSLTQPLARDAGAEVTQARVNMARLDTVAADHASRDTEISVVAEAILAYHELVFAQQRVSAAQEKINTSTRLLGEAQALRRLGRLAQTEVWEVENALARYRSALSEAIQNQRERSNRLRAMLMMDPSPTLFRAVDELPAVETTPVDATESLRIALSKRDDYLMRKTQAEREGIQLVYAKNQKLPRIDLVASYGLSGLEFSGRQALEWQRMQNYPAWTLGVQVNVPLGANKQADADLQAALLRREDALLAVKALETQIAVDIDTSAALLTSMTERWTLWREVATREGEQLAAERVKFNAGRSDTRELLLRQERVINARLSVQEQQVGYARARTLLQAAQGLLMERLP